MFRKRSLAALGLLVPALLLSACGGGGGAGTTTGTTTGGTNGTNQSPTPLDTQLQTLVEQANVTPQNAPPPDDPNLVLLGQSLFFDPLLSGNLDMACATCHQPAFATGDALSVSIGTGGVGDGPDRQLGTGKLIARNAPPLFALGGQRSMFWGGRVEQEQDGTFRTPEAALNGRNPTAGDIVAELDSALAAQALFPLVSRDEMRGQAGENELADAATNLAVWQAIMERLVGRDDGTVGGLAAYRQLFSRAYPAVTNFDDLNIGHAARAIAAFERSTFRQTASPFDDWLRGQLTAMTDSEKRGGILFFGRLRCARCHGGPRLTDGRFHSVGVPQVGPGADAPLEDSGRFNVTGDLGDKYRFRTPALRNVALTGPWMHDGAYTTLENVVRHYEDPLRALANYDASQLSPLLQDLVDTDPARQAARAASIDGGVRRGLQLDAQERTDLLGFLGSLTDPEVFGLDQIVPASVPSGLGVQAAP